MNSNRERHTLLQEFKELCFEFPLQDSDTARILSLDNLLEQLDLFTTAQYPEILLDPGGTPVRPSAKGASGQIFKLECLPNSWGIQHIAVKRIPIASNDCGSESLARAFCELRSLHYLHELFVRTRLTPHIVLPLTYRQSPRFVYIAMPYAELDTLRQFLTQVTPAHLALYAEIFLFQMLYTLSWISHIYPDFHHNDTSLENVLIEFDPALGKPLLYRACSGKVFCVPSTGYRVLLADFGFSNNCGVVDSLDALAYAYNSQNRGVSVVGKPWEDSYWLVTRLCKMYPELCTTDFGMRLSRLYGASIFTADPTAAAQKEWPSGPDLLELLFPAWSLSETVPSVSGQTWGVRPEQLEAIFTQHHFEAVYEQLPRFVHAPQQPSNVHTAWFGGSIPPQASWRLPSRILYSTVLRERELETGAGSTVMKPYAMCSADAIPRASLTTLQRLYSQYYDDSSPVARDEWLHNSTALLQHIVEFLGGQIERRQAPVLATLAFFLEMKLPAIPQMVKWLFQELDSFDSFKTYALVFQYQWIRSLMRRPQTFPVKSCDQFSFVPAAACSDQESLPAPVQTLC